MMRKILHWIRLILVWGFLGLDLIAIGVLIVTTIYGYAEHLLNSHGATNIFFNGMFLAIWAFLCLLFLDLELDWRK